MNNGINKSNLLHTAPHVLLNDAGMNPMVHTVADALDRLAGHANLPMIYARIDELPEDLLDILAKDFKVDWYDYNWGIEAKRATIKDSFYVHRHLGTKSAVLRAVRDVYVASNLHEWFEYGGDPYYFRIMLEASQQRAPIHLPGVLKAIDLFKSARSHLEGGMVIVSVTCNIVIQTHQDGQYFHTRVAGTYPRITTHGSISDEHIIVETSEEQQKYTSPVTGKCITGTYPRVSTHGDIADAGIVIESGQESREYKTPVTGELRAGQYPQTTSHGNIADGHIAIESEGGGQDYNVPITGTRPAVSTHGNADNGGMTIGVASDGASFSSRRCGTPNGSLM